MSGNAAPLANDLRRRLRRALRAGAAPVVARTRLSRETLRLAAGGGAVSASTAYLLELTLPGAADPTTPRPPGTCAECLVAAPDHAALCPARTTREHPFDPHDTA